jgi:hypothetical protein
MSAAPGRPIVGDNARKLIAIVDAKSLAVTDPVEQLEPERSVERLEQLEPLGSYFHGQIRPACGN